MAPKATMVAPISRVQPGRFAPRVATPQNSATHSEHSARLHRADGRHRDPGCNLAARLDQFNMGAKKFYHFSGVRYPLHIHDGGLLDANVRALLEHFPHAKFVSRADADREVEAALTRLRAPRSLEYRRRSALGLKLFDVFLLSHARTVLSIDSDILFFRRPDELIGSEGGPNLYNKDANYYYCLSLDEIQSRFESGPSR